MLQLFTVMSEVLLQSVIAPAYSLLFLQFCVFPGLTTHFWAVESRPVFKHYMPYCEGQTLLEDEPLMSKQSLMEFFIGFL